MKILFLGDLYFNPQKKNRVFNVSEELLEKIRLCDYVCYNLEGPIIGTFNKPNNCKKGPVIYQDEARIASLIKQIPTKQIANLANNHIMDFGKEGLEYTLTYLKNRCMVMGAGLSYENAYRPLILCDNKLEIAILSVAEGGFGVLKERISKEGYAWFLDATLTEQIVKLKAKYNKVIVISHAGLEDEILPLPEIRKIYKKFIDNGADLVVAHHPHVIQGYELYKSKKIFYSLGNFIFDNLDYKREQSEQSIGIVVDIEKSNINTEVIPIKYFKDKCTIDNGSLTQFKKASQLLNSKEYYTLINEICSDCYTNIYKGYYLDVCGVRSIPGVVKLIIYKLFRKQFIDEDMLYHNILIETHYWTTCRGLIYRKNNNVK